MAADDVEQMVKLIDRLTPDLVVVGPEAPLVAGLADRLRAMGVPAFGPGADAARLEGSKAWSKRVMEAGSIPTAGAGTFTEVGPAVAFVRELGGRAVVKADGLAAGKGVTVADDRRRWPAAIRDCLEGGAFGEAGAPVVVEELLEGPEVSRVRAGRRPRACPSASRRTSSGSATATPGPTPAAWAPTRRCRSSTEATERSIERHRRADGGDDGIDGHRYSGRACTRA